MLVKYEYEIFDRYGNVAASGEFSKRVYGAYSIRSKEVETEGHFGVLEHAHEALESYRGRNYLLKTTKIKATNLITGTVRYI